MLCEGVGSFFRWYIASVIGIILRTAAAILAEIYGKEKAGSNESRREKR